MIKDKQAILQQIDQALDDARRFYSGSAYDDGSDKPESNAVAVVNQLAATIDRLAPAGSHHKRSMERHLKERGGSYAAIQPLVGSLIALRTDYELGHLQTFEELIHADTSAGYIDMAETLHESGYKDAAAVIAGSVLEQHLRSLCTKVQIPIESSGRYKKAEMLNSELATQTVYSKLDQKNVTAWLGLRNEAAHGNYSGYTADQVRLMINAVQDFMARCPA